MKLFIKREERECLISSHFLTQVAVGGLPANGAWILVSFQLTRHWGPDWTLCQGAECYPNSVRSDFWIAQENLPFMCSVTASAVSCLMPRVPLFINKTLFSSSLIPEARLQGKPVMRQLNSTNFTLFKKWHNLLGTANFSWPSILKSQLHPNSKGKAIFGFSNYCF